MNEVSKKGLFDGLTQADIPNLLEKVTQQIKDLRGGIPVGPKATGSLGGYGKIESINSVETLIKAHFLVVAKERGYQESAKVLLPNGIKVPPFTLHGSSAKDWVTDIKARVLIVANKTQLDKLTKIKNKLEANLSAEAKLAKDLADVQSILFDE